MKLLQPMLPTLVTSMPKGKRWLYEVKYDGFRAITYINDNDVSIISRNLVYLNEQFPELVSFFQQLKLKNTIIDGEICILENNLKASFERMQKRGRLKNKEKILTAAETERITYVVFDLLKHEQTLLSERFEKRREELLRLHFDDPIIKISDVYDDPYEVWSHVQQMDGEGVIAKAKESVWQPRVRTKNWLKLKNMKIGTFFIVCYDEKNSYFHIGCIIDESIKMIGKVGQGFSTEEKGALIAIIKKNATDRTGTITMVKPSICIEVEFLDLSKHVLRHPKFRRFRFDKMWEDCRWEAIKKVELN